MGKGPKKVSGWVGGMIWQLEHAMAVPKLENMSAPLIDLQVVVDLQQFI